MVTFFAPDFGGTSAKWYSPLRSSSVDHLSLCIYLMYLLPCHLCNEWMKPGQNKILHIWQCYISSLHSPFIAGLIQHCYLGNLENIPVIFVDVDAVEAHSGTRSPLRYSSIPTPLLLYIQIYNESCFHRLCLDVGCFYMPKSFSILVWPPSTLIMNDYLWAGPVRGDCLLVTPKSSSELPPTYLGT